MLIGVAVLGAIGIATYAARARDAADVVSAAQRNAALVRSLEAWLGLEPVMSWGAQLGAGRSGSVAAVIYSIGYWPFLLAGLAISLRSERTLFQRTILSVAVSGLVGLTVMAWFPVAPPRLLGELDVIAKHQMSAFAHPDGLINPYAAMPSFHIAWSLISALAIGAAVPRARRIALAYPAVMSVVVIITGNHYVLDLIAGALIAVAAWWFCGTPRCAALLTPRTAPVDRGAIASQGVEGSVGIVSGGGRRNAR